MKRIVCHRGEIWLVNFNPGRGSEQQGIRPALIVQNETGNQHSLTTIVAAITTTLKKFPVTVLLDKNEGGLSKRSMINLAHILTIDKSRLTRKLGALSETRMKEVNRAAKVSLALDDD